MFLIFYIIASVALAQTATAQGFQLIVPPVILEPLNSTEIFYVVPERGEPPDRFELPCIAQGTPQPIYSWIKDGRTLKRDVLGDRVTQIVGTGTLVFSGGRETDAGLYQCVVQNEGGVATSVPVSLTKAFMGNFADTSLKMVYADEGKPMKLECNAPPANPKPEIFWLKQSTSGAVSTINSTRITPDPVGNLWFSYTEALDDSGADSTYVCTATSNILGSYKIGSRVKLNVRGSRNQTSTPPVRQYTSPSSMMVFEGTDVELFCIHGGKPTPTTIWKKDGQVLEAGYRLKFGTNKNSLELKNVAFNDTGIYICESSNGIPPTQNYTINLEVQSKPKIVGGNEPMARMVTTGDDVFFECKAEGVPLPTVEWHYNSAPLRNSVPNPRRIVTETSLSIRNIEKSDVGSYSCIAANGHGIAIKQGYISVGEFPPQPTGPAVNTTASVGDVAELNCPVFGLPSPRVQWIRNNDVIISPRFEQANVTKLRIHNVQHSDAGDYICSAVNKFGELSVTLNLKVEGVFKITQPPQDRSAQVGDWTTLSCAVESSRNDVEIDWMKDNVFISFEVMPQIVRGIDGSITIFKLSANDAGVYTCVAKSGLEERRASATLTVTTT